MFNALEYTERLEGAGFTPEQAQASMRILIEVMDQNFATKADLENVARDLRTEIRELRAELHIGLEKIEYKLTIKLGAMLTVAVAVMAALTKIL